MEGEEAGVRPEVMEEGGQGSEQDGDSNHGAMPLVKVGEERLICRCGVERREQLREDGKMSQGWRSHGDVGSPEQA